MRNHTLIVASSGSGKSFFLGRVIEEVLLSANNRVIVFDPNSDFTRITSTVPGKMWTSAKYNTTTKEGHLPHERLRRKFKEPWDRKQKRVYSAGEERPAGSFAIELDWLEFPLDWFSDNSDLAFQNELRNCHRFVKTLADLFFLSKTITWRSKNKLLEFARDFCLETRDDSKGVVIDKLKARFAADAEGSSYQTRQCRLPVGASVDEFTQILEPHIRDAGRHRTFVTEQAQRTYFGVAQDAKESGIFSTRMPVSNLPRVAAHVVDLLSIEHTRFRLMVVSKFLQEEFGHAKKNRDRVMARMGKRGAKDTRKPIFVVVDEAHNLIPNQPDSRALEDVRNQFRTIASEGRKFGVFLILVTQEPSKLDSQIVSLCSNRAIMKMSRGRALKSAIELLGLGRVAKTQARFSPDFPDFPDFERGRVMLFGPWARGMRTFLYGAMRRTAEGGGNLP